ncbi:hypothetical protein BHYA_0184g00070 [Botrytis hyacinthi]|uniref:Uncharacterized protein n=1 Tax=Botrytis hyacinthi TaxID=278943 RepID=A0A4Z1GCM6_9HELO|nr:hypothetical protein BHYA_0184g00070 [Botrytis hyacinthi]
MTNAKEFHEAHESNARDTMHARAQMRSEAIKANGGPKISVYGSTVAYTIAVVRLGVDVINSNS